MKLEHSIGNSKIGKDTLIFNMGSATNCPSGRKGLCELYSTNNCYALKSEKMYKEVLPYRTRQESQWLNNDAIAYAEEITRVFSTNNRRKIPLKFVRINEAGDMHSNECLSKLIEIANMLPDIIFYTYTHRSDIIGDGVTLPSNLVINTSNFTAKGCNSFSIEPTLKVRSLKKEIDSAKTAIRAIHGKGALVCAGGCATCNLCKVNHGKTIWLPLH